MRLRALFENVLVCLYLVGVLDERACALLCSHVMSAILYAKPINGSYIFSDDAPTHVLYACVRIYRRIKLRDPRQRATTTATTTRFASLLRPGQCTLHLNNLSEGTITTCDRCGGISPNVRLVMPMVPNPVFPTIIRISCAGTVLIWIKTRFRRVFTNRFWRKSSTAHGITGSLKYQ